MQISFEWTQKFFLPSLLPNPRKKAQIFDGGFTRDYVFESFSGVFFPTDPSELGSEDAKKMGRSSPSPTRPLAEKATFVSIVKPDPLRPWGVISFFVFNEDEAVLDLLSVFSGSLPGHSSFFSSGNPRASL